MTGLSTERGLRRARETAFRVAFQADLMRESFRDAWAGLREEARLSGGLAELVGDVVAALESRLEEVDQVLRQATEHWEVERLAATDRSVLRAAVAELLSRPGTPARVILNEAIDIAKRYGSEESGRFVNGVLDRAARALRPEEF